jgi:hypothetical protein
MSEEVKEGSLGFGCANCWPADADLAATAVRNTNTRVRLADESHFMLAIRACDTCAQRFLFCFTESIDWAGGDDAQYVTYLPLTIVESQEVELLDGLECTARSKAIGIGRRCLQIDHPTGKPKRVMWNTGFSIGPHD